MFFKSLKWRLVSIFFLLVISIMIVVGTYLLYAVEKAYKDEFVYQMNQSKSVFSEKNIEQDISEDSPNYSVELFKTFRNIFLINNVNRKGYLLDNLGSIIYASDSKEEISGNTVPKTPNILTSMNGTIGNKLPNGDEQLDYAKPILRDGKVKYILYIKYNKEGLKNILDRLKSVILYSVLSALGISIVLGYLLAQAITGPISSLTDKAEKMASGDFDNMLENHSGDELGKLTHSFNYMSQELKRTLNQISSEKSKLVTILLHMADGVIAFSKEGEIIHANPASYKMLEIEDAGEKDFTLIFSHIGLNVTREEILKIDQGETIQHQIAFKDRYYKAVFAPFRSDNLEPIGIIAVIQDVTEQQKLENMRREFVANVSHELKTPLTSIQTYAETLLDGALEEREVAADFLGVINSEAARMSRIVSDLLQLSRLDYREARWHKVEINLGAMAQDVIEKMKIEARKKQQTLECTVKSNVPYAFADKDGIEQVVINIISNSLKYTPEKGRINVEVGNANGIPHIKVSDNGIGIPENDLPRIFERFYRVDKARSRDMGGTGLGLSIAKEIVEANGGSIAMDSKLGKGTEVTIALPVSETEEVAIGC
jgi:two-component system sensor histidine kinase VicK